jgi:hypothetical protein
VTAILHDATGAVHSLTANDCNHDPLRPDIHGDAVASDLDDRRLAVVARNGEITAIHRDGQVFRYSGPIAVENAPSPPGVHVDDDDRGMRPVTTGVAKQVLSRAGIDVTV